MEWFERAQKHCQKHKIRDKHIAEAVNISTTTVSFWMRGIRQPKLEQKIGIAKALGVSVHWLDTGLFDLPDQQLIRLSIEQLDEVLPNLIGEQTEETGQVMSALPTSFMLAPGKAYSSFLLNMDNDTMLNPNAGDSLLLPEHSLVQINLDAPLQPGKILLIHHDGSYKLRRWHRVSATDHRFSVISPLYPNLSFLYQGPIEEIATGVAVACSFPL